MLGVSIAYWLSSVYDCSIAVADSAGGVAAHTSSRNTGVVHRPFYLDPDRKKVFARSAAVSYPLWRKFSRESMLPWVETGTLEAAPTESGIAVLHKYLGWAEKNGMEEAETELLDGREVASLEPEVHCAAALHSKTDTSVDFGLMTRRLFDHCDRAGVDLLSTSRVERVSTGPTGRCLVSFSPAADSSGVSCRFLVNAGGAGALTLAHKEGLARDLSALYFRGDYWRVAGGFAKKVGRNVYTPPRHPAFPFLDPHLVVRADGTRQVGPNAVLVGGPYAYQGFGFRHAPSSLERPLGPKLRLAMNTEFLSLLAGEWRSSLSKDAMARRVRKFIPRLDTSLLEERGLAGVRGSVVSSRGFEPEAILVFGEESCHVLNYNSPGATGAPAFSAKVVKDLQSEGRLDGLRKRPRLTESPWSFDEVASSI